MCEEFICIYCKKRKKANPRLKSRQLYCDDRRCQRARKAKWKRERLQVDPLFKANHSKECVDWRRRNRRYWSRYRRTHPRQTQRNRDLQIIRDIKRKQRFATNNLAKVDALKTNPVSALENGSTYWLVPFLAKVDALRVKLIVISGNSSPLAKVDAIDAMVEGM